MKILQCSIQLPLNFYFDSLITDIYGKNVQVFKNEFIKIEGPYQTFYGNSNEN